MRVIGAALLISALAAVPAGAEGVPWDAVRAAPDGAALERLTSELGSAQRVRIFSSGRTLELRQPWFDASGIHYQSVKGLPAARPALFVSGLESPALPPNPVPWSAVERVERPGRSAGFGRMLGGTVGFFGGVMLASAAGVVVGNLTHSSVKSTVPLLGVGIGGAVLGGIVIGWSSNWKQVYPTP